MKRISIERYNPPILGDKTGDGYGGLIEGVRDDGTTWIMFLDEGGSPVRFWGLRDEDGGVVGEAIALRPPDETNSLSVVP